MSRLLHTADVHLAATDDERMAALRTVLRRAAAEEVDVLTIGGDLFDRPADVENLRPTLRNDLFTDRDYDILLIPGNHDVSAFRGDVFFGDACTVVTETPFGHWTAPAGDLRITGLPYRERVGDDLLLALQDRDPFDGTEVLLLHGSLDAPFDTETGDEEERRYFPVTESLLTELGFDHYLAGHYHSSHTVRFGDGSTFTYPGTPASTRTTETGRRHLSVLDTAEGVSLEPIETFHYARKHLTSVPGSEESLLETVRMWADTHATDAAEAHITVDGFVGWDEREFAGALEAAADPASVTDETRGVAHVQSHPLYRAFEAELEGTEWDEETREAVRTRTLEVFSHLSARGEI